MKKMLLAIASFATITVNARNVYYCGSAVFSMDS